MGRHRATHRLWHGRARVRHTSRLAEIESHFSLLTVFSAPTRVIALENTLNGTIIPQKDVLEISKNAHARDIIMHLDGARIWHVAVETGLSMKEICDPFDSVSLCLSKGLGKTSPISSSTRFVVFISCSPGAPIGTCLVGTKAFITKARWFRKLFGGGMRQTGYLVGCVAYALTHNFPQLPRVHALAKRMQQGLEDIGVGILSPAETCIVRHLTFVSVVGMIS